MKKMLYLFSMSFFSLCNGSVFDSKNVKEKEKVPGSYVANWGTEPKYSFKKLRDKKQVQTDWDNKKIKASKPYRKLVYELLEEYAKKRPALVAKEDELELVLAKKPGYNLVHPEIVMLINRDDMAAGPVEIGDSEFRGIEYKKKDTDKELFGDTRLGFLHEITHLSEQHHKNCVAELFGKEARCLFDQPDETTADDAAVIVGQCIVCTNEFTDNWFANFKKDRHSDYKKIPKDRFTYLQSLDRTKVEKMADDELSKLITETDKYSLAQKTSMHPLDIARGLRIIQLMRDGEYGVPANAKCVYHTLYGSGLTTKQMFAKIKASASKIAGATAAAAESDAEKERRLKVLKEEEVKALAAAEAKRLAGLRQAEQEAQAARKKFWEDMGKTQAGQPKGAAQNPPQTALSAEELKKKAEQDAQMARKKFWEDLTKK